MQKQNIREYEIVRSELVNIRNCITNYIGFLIGGSGFAFIGLVFVVNYSQEKLLAQVGIPLVLSTLITMTQMILFYKFLSHNRYAGYCKLLNHELHEPFAEEAPLDNDVDIILWEACMDTLRKSDFDESLLEKALGSKVVKLCEEEDNEDEDVLRNKKLFVKMIDDISKKNAPVDKGIWRHLYGFKYLRAIFGSNKADSWPFPALVNAIFILLTPLFLITAVYFLIAKMPQEDGQFVWQKVYLLCLVATILVCVYHFIMWVIFAGKLFTLLQGRNTVDHFCWRFLPFRAQLLNSSKRIRPKYFFMWCDAHKKQKTGQVCL